MSYVDEVYSKTVEDNPGEYEFHQAVKEILDSLKLVIDSDEKKYRDASLLERLIEPERIISFRVPWVDDSGHLQINKGYRIPSEALREALILTARGNQNAKLWPSARASCRSCSNISGTIWISRQAISGPAPGKSAFSSDSIKGWPGSTAAP